MLSAMKRVKLKTVSDLLFHGICLFRHIDIEEHKKRKYGFFTSSCYFS